MIIRISNNSRRRFLAELIPHGNQVDISLNCKNTNIGQQSNVCEPGRYRTDDPLIKSQMLYH